MTSFFLLIRMRFALCLILLIAAHSRAADFSQVHACITNAITHRVFPCCVILVMHKGNTVYHEAFGRSTYEPTAPAAQKDTLFDCASLTKLFTATIAMILYDQGRLALTDSVALYLPALPPTKHAITIKDLLVHESGIQSVDELPLCATMTAQEIKKQVCALPLTAEPGTTYRYDCGNMLLLHWVLEAITAVTLGQLITDWILAPLGMHRSYTQVPHALYAACAPTGRGYETLVSAERSCIQGRVHDYKAHCLGGFAGNAGLFSTAADLAVFMDCIRRYGAPLVRPETARLWLAQHSVKGNRALGWALAPDANLSCGHYFSSSAYGHLGFTGTSLWYDPCVDVGVVFLTNRVYESSDLYAIRQVRTQVHDLIMGCLGYAA